MYSDATAQAFINTERVLGAAMVIELRLTNEYDVSQVLEELKHELKDVRRMQVSI